MVFIFDFFRALYKFLSWNYLFWSSQSTRVNDELEKITESPASKKTFWILNHEFVRIAITCNPWNFRSKDVTVVTWTLTIVEWISLRRSPRVFPDPMSVFSAFSRFCPTEVILIECNQMNLIRKELIKKSFFSIFGRTIFDINSKIVRPNICPIGIENVSEFVSLKYLFVFCFAAYFFSRIFVSLLNRWVAIMILTVANIQEI